jgi:hypothetical protein
VEALDNPDHGISRKAKRRDTAARFRLECQGAASVRWLTRHLDRFSPWSDGRLTDAGIQAFAELAIAYAYLAGWQDCERGPATSLYAALPRWREFILTECLCRTYAEMARKRPSQAYALLLPYLSLRATGYRSPYDEETLRRLERWGYPAASEVVPYRLLDRHYFLWKSGCLRREPRWAELYRATLLGHDVRLAYIDREGAYSVTHTLFYLADFGKRPIPLPPEEVARVTMIVECLLIHYWRVAHWDLVGELLISLNCLDARDTPISRGAARAFARAQLPDGAVPAQRPDVASAHPAEEDEGDMRHFRACYHTTLVNMLYCATTLNRGANESITA